MGLHFLLFMTRVCTHTDVNISCVSWMVAMRVHSNFWKSFDARRVVQGGGGVRSEERRKTSTVRQGGRTRAIR